MLIIKSADWLHVARPILLLYISLAEVVIRPPPPVILWQVASQSFNFFKSISSRLQVASQSYFSPVSHISRCDWLRRPSPNSEILNSVLLIRYRSVKLKSQAESEVDQVASYQLPCRFFSPDFITRSYFQI